MKQEKVAGKILLELMDLGIVEEDNQEIVHAYLLWAYAAGYNTGSKARSNKKPVLQMTLSEEPIEVFESCADAFRKTKVGVAEISRCALGKAHTAGGFKWKYIDEKKPNSSEGSGTVGGRSGKPTG